MAKKEKEEPKMSSKAKGKLSALQGLHEMITEMMGDDLKKGKQVTVVAKDKKGLKKGLNKAEELLDEEELED